MGSKKREPREIVGGIIYNESFTESYATNSFLRLKTAIEKNLPVKYLDRQQVKIFTVFNGQNPNWLKLMNRKTLFRI